MLIAHYKRNMHATHFLSTHHQHTNLRALISVAYEYDYVGDFEGNNSVEDNELPREGRVQADTTPGGVSRNKFSEVRNTTAKRYPYGLSPTRHYNYRVYKIRTERKAGVAGEKKRRVVVAQRRRQNDVAYNEELDTFQSPGKPGH